MISCVFCSCELPSRVGRAKYLEHLQVRAALLPVSQDWHLITRPEEVARALHLAFPGEQAGEMAKSKVQEEEEEENSDDEDDQDGEGDGGGVFDDGVNYQCAEVAGYLPD